MRVLLVEDRPKQVAAVTSAFGDDVTFFVAATRDAALELITTEHFDVAVCDLKIPPSDGAPGNVEHGLAVLTAVRDRCSGTPIVTFTGYKTKAVLELFVRQQRQEDYLGTMEARPMLLVMEKDELPELLAHLEELRGEFATLEDIEVASGLGQPPVSAIVARVVRVYARQRGCVLSRVTTLTGGLSGVPVVRVEMEKADGAGGGSAVGRIGPIGTVDEERIRFQRHVSGVLPLGSYAETIGVVRAGAGSMGGVFYQVAEDAEPLWRLPSVDDERAAVAVDALRAVHNHWTQSAPAETVSLRDIRRILIVDSRWAEVSDRCELRPEEVAALEDTHVHIRRSTVHADLHGGNILVATEPVLIDFASVTLGPTPLDPVTLELSLLFHPDAPKWDPDWPTEAQLERWAEIDAFVAGCPFPNYVRACRAWATSVARGDRDILACAYSYVASQARFETSEEQRLAALMRGIRPHFA